MTVEEKTKLKRYPARNFKFCIKVREIAVLYSPPLISLVYDPRKLARTSHLKLTGHLKFTQKFKHDKHSLRLRTVTISKLMGANNLSQ